MKSTLTIIQIILSILLMVCILFQSQGQGLGMLGGGGGESFKSRQGIEKFLFRLTILLAVLFLISLIGQFVIS